VANWAEERLWERGDSQIERNVPPGVPYTYANLTETSHTFTARAKDLAWNVNPVAFTWTVDTTPPDVAINTMPANPSNQKSGKIGFSSTDTTATFECKLDTGVFAGCSSPYAYTNLTDGGHTFSVQAKDPAGNVTATPVAYSWNIDTIAPSLTLNPLPSSTNATSLTVSGTNETGAAVTVSVNSGSAMPATVTGTTWSYSFTSLIQGANSIQITASDAAGNTTVIPASITCNAAKLTVGIGGTGGGTVTSNPAGISCLTGTCAYLFDKDTTVKLMASPNSISTFGGWTGAFTSSLKNYDVAMSTDQSVTATFTAAPKAMIGSAGYTSLNAAYTAASTTAVTTILTLDTDLVESLTIDNGKWINLIGGYDGSYSGRTGIMTGLKGALIIGNGSLTVDGLEIK
jgi:hypothetical protein